MAHPGELVGASQPLLQMADTDHMAVIAEVYETDIQRVKEKQTVTIRSRTFDGDAQQNGISGEVVHLGEMIMKKPRLRLRSHGRRRPPGVRGQNRIADKDSQLLAHLIHHQVTVEIDVPGP